jgi:predicted ATP-grasp superfamily ATP-dependent carboligase
MSMFVTDGEQRPTLAVVRALGRARIPVIVGTEHPPCLAGVSRYCIRTVRYPSPLTEPETFRVFLEQEMRSGRYRVLLPMTDVTIQLLAPRNESTSLPVCLPIPCNRKIQLVQDKQQLLKLAERLGIPFPKTYVLGEQESMEDFSQRVSYPAVIKPRFSRFLQNRQWQLGHVQYARDQSDLIQKYRQSDALIPRPLVQEKIEGEGRGVFLLMWDGQLKAAFCHRRLREKPPWGGASVYCESVAPNQELVEESVSLLQLIGWQGVAMLEYKMDRRDGEAKLMEVNGRFWGSLQLAIDAGMNFPLMLYRLATGEQVAPTCHYRVGVRSRWLLGDLDHLLIRLKHRFDPDGSECSTGFRLRACVDFLKPSGTDTRNEVFRFADPVPGWFEVKNYVRNCL